MNVNVIETVACQLHVAAEFLSSRDSVHARLALILADNSVELLFHIEAEEALLGPAQTNVDESRIRLVEAALGEGFDAKVKYSQWVGLVDGDGAQLAREAHKFRNQAYHTGRVHDDVLGELAHIYYDLACNILCHLRVASFSSHFDRPYEVAYPIIAKYGAIKESTLGWVDLKHLSESLLTAKAKSERSLARVIRCLLKERIARIKAGIAVLFKAGRCGAVFRSVDELLFEIQLWDEFFSCAPLGRFRIVCGEDGTCRVDPAQEGRYRKALDAIKQWTPSITERTLAALEKQIDQLHDGLPSGRVLQKYWNLSSKIVPLQNAIERQLGWLELANDSHRESQKGNL